MTDASHKATKTRSNRPGWSVTFRHPRRSDARGKPGLKVRRGLGTTDAAEADRLVDQLNELLGDQTWWSVDRRTEAEQRFDSVVVSAFFDGMEVGKVNSGDLREARIPLPSQAEGYARVMFAGTTGAGKTTLLRHVIGSDHERDRFPSTSTARTTTADIEIITADGPFEAIITFMPEHEVRAHVDECLEEACLGAIQGQPVAKIAGALLSHREQRFRLSYPLGPWQRDAPSSDKDFSFHDEEVEEDFLDDNEAVTAEDRAHNRERLDQYVARINEIAASTGDRVAAGLGVLDDMNNPDDRAAWLEVFTDALFEEEEFGRLALDIMEAIEDRFGLVESGDFEHGPTGWPILWSFGEEDRDAFLQQVRWFASNHHRQFGRLLTPLVDGMRVRGPFRPAHDDLQIADRLVLLDGQGLGHTAKSASSISTRVTRRFSDVDMIVLVDNAEQPMQAAPLELLRSVGMSGHADKLAVAFTHFDLVKGHNLGNYEQKRDHVLGSVGNAIASLRQPLGAPVAGMLERQIEGSSFFLGGLDRAPEKIPSGFRTQLRDLIALMQAAAEPAEPVETAPRYTTEGLEIALRDAVEGFLEPWKGRLGLRYHDGIPKEHWTRVKALSRRFANAWSNEYDDLRPVADLVARLQENISRWLDSPAGWTREPESQEGRDAALAFVRKMVFDALHDLAEERLSDVHRPDWQTAYGFSGRGSGHRRAEEIDRIYEEAAPAMSSAMSGPARQFLHNLHRIVREAVEAAGGQFEKIAA
jgi:hypothetical protein